MPEGDIPERDELGRIRKGSSGNVDGRPPTKAGRGKPISGLRRTLTRLKRLEPKSLENIEKSINDEPIDKETLATSKWLINSLGTIHKAAVSEEKDLLHIRDHLEGGGNLEEEIDAEVLEWSPAFSLTRLESVTEIVEKEIEEGVNR